MHYAWIFCAGAILLKQASAVSAIKEASLDIQSVADLRKISFSKEGSLDARWKALQSLVQIQGIQAEKDLSRALSSPDWFMRNGALVAYQKIDQKKGHVAGLKLLNDKALVVRSAAVQALDPLMNEKDRARLWDELNQDYNFRRQQSLWVRGDILSLLAQAPQEKEAKMFALGLRDPDERLHGPAMTALEKIYGKKVDTQLDSKAQRHQWLAFIKNQKTVR
jgi:HEAT repeat protein